MDEVRRIDGAAALLNGVLIGAVAMVLGRMIFTRLPDIALLGPSLRGAYGLAGDVMLALVMLFVLLTIFRLRRIWGLGLIGLGAMLFGEPLVAMQLPDLWRMLFSDGYASIAMTGPARGFELLAALL
ncbi:MAG: hypothetical protein ACU0DW_08885 [Shimia sp.]